MAHPSQAWAESIPKLPSDFAYSDLAAATTLTPTNEPDTYTCDLKADWAIGTVPHGGYLAALITHAAQRFSAAQHPDLQQTDLITLHQEFISACVFGPASIHITVLSRGRQYSTLRLQLSQRPGHDTSKKALLRIEALVRQGSLTRERASGGHSLPTLPPSSKWPPPERNACIERKDLPALFARRPAFGKVIFLLAGDTNELGEGAGGPSVRAQWVRWRDGARRFDGIAALAYLADTHRPLIEAYGVVGCWFPTLNMSLDVRKAPPEGGWEWLFMRIEIHACRDGRFDYDVVILDEEGELVAMSKHANLIVSSERNYKRSSAVAKI